MLQNIKKITYLQFFFLNYKLIILQKKIYFQRFLLETYNQQHFVKKNNFGLLRKNTEFLKVWVLKNKKREKERKHDYFL